MSKHASQSHASGPEVPDRIAYLITAFLQHKLSPAEREELDEWVGASGENLKLFEELVDEKNLGQGAQWMQKLNIEGARNKIHSRLGFRVGKPLWVVFLPYAIAACLLLLAGIGLYYFFLPTAATKQQLVVTSPQPAELKAFLTTSDGKTFDLQQLDDGPVAAGNGYTLTKQADFLILKEGAGEEKDTAGQHTLYIPKGGRYNVQLPDGTKIWINADTRIAYSANNKKERKVQLSGEAYFEVEPDPQKPFLVYFNGAQVKVLGTHFNIKAYSGAATKATLLEGSISIQKNGVQKVLRPGQQATVDENEKNNNVIHLSNTDIFETTAWKEGQFVFRDATINEVIAEIARWYNLSVEYAGPISHHFNGSFDRNTALPKLLAYLEGTNRVHFTLNGRQLKVLP